MEIRTHWQRVKINCPNGERIEMRHRAVLRKDGTRTLVRDKEKPTWDIIQSHKEECLIENILKRCMEGDLSALETMHGSYCDISNAPSSLAEAQQTILKLKQEFNELPKEIRKEFDYNVEKYIAEFGTEEWAEKTGVAEKIRKEEEIRKAQQEYIANTEEAMKNLAQGLVVRKEEKPNE